MKPEDCHPGLNVQSTEEAIRTLKRTPNSFTMHKKLRFYIYHLLPGLEINMACPNAHPGLLDQRTSTSSSPRVPGSKDIFRPKKTWKPACPDLWEGLAWELKLQTWGQRGEVLPLAHWFWFSLYWATEDSQEFRVSEWIQGDGWVRKGQLSIQRAWTAV